MKNCLAIGRFFFAIAMIASGLLQIIRHDFVRLVPKLPSWIPWPPFWAVVSGAVLIGIGLAIATDRKRPPAAIGLAALFFLVLLLRIPEICSNPWAGFMWTNPCKTLALIGGALVVAVLPARRVPSQPNALLDRLTVEQARLLCAALFGLFLVVCGVQHFVYADFVIQMVPAWMPGRGFWAYFTGIFLIAGGLGVNLRPTAGLAALLAGLMIFLWVVLLHIPRALASWPDAGEIAGIFEALALSGTALLLGAVTQGRTSSPGKPLMA